MRKELGVRTIFNVLGPLTNPAGARRQLIGVYDDHLVAVIAEVLLELGCEHALVVHGSDGLDEITTTGPTLVAEVRGGKIEVYELEPADLAIPWARPEDLSGGAPEDNAELLRGLLEGRGGPLADVTALNAAAALYVGGVAGDLGTGLALAREALGSGAAADKLEELRQLRWVG